LENEKLALVCISFSEHGILCFVSVPPNTLRKFSESMISYPPQEKKRKEKKREGNKKPKEKEKRRKIII
jgi:hypothetical protein